MATTGDYVCEPYLPISWDGVNQHVFSEWKACANSAELRAGLLKGIQAIGDIWLPLAMAAGLNRIAFVTAATGLGKLTIEDVSGLLDENGLQSRTFDSMAAARQWVSEPGISPVTGQGPEVTKPPAVPARNSGVETRR